MNKRLFVTFAVSVFAVALGVFTFATAETAAQDYSDHTVVITTAEYLTVDGEGSGIEFFVEGNNFELLQRDTGNGQLTQDFVYNDPRNNQFDGGVAGMSYAVAENNLSGDAGLLGKDPQVFWLYNSVETWGAETCSNMNPVPVESDNDFPGIVNIFFSGGGIPLIQQADLTQVGFLSAAEFPYFAANPNVLGVAFTLSWVDAEGNLTDIDGNGKSDVAFREIYYNDEFEWTVNGVDGVRGTGIIDFPTVAIHEAGHGVNAAHFGSIGRKDGTLVANPRSVMNAIYGGTFRDLGGRDKGSHCSNWAQWPNN